MKRGKSGVEPAWGRSAVALAALAILMPAAGQGQIAPTFSGTSSAQYYSGDAVLQELDRVGGCIARRKRSQSENFIAAVPGSSEEAGAYKSLIGRNTTCLGDLTKMRIAQAHLRGAIAEALYKQRFVSSPASPSPLAAAVPATVMGQFADCYARAHPQQVHALLTRTTITSDGERAAVARMAADFGPCLPAGARVALRPSEVRLGLAEALYRASAATAPVAAGN